MNHIALPQPQTQTALPDTPAMLLSVADLARELRISVKTIARMDQAGKLPRPIRVGSRAKRWARATIVEWIAAGAPCRREWERLNR
jgi:predicted DNA-binding transcriptional regulator AlpA